MLRTKFALIGYLCREWYPVSQGAGKNLVKLKPLARGYIDEVCMRIVDLVFFRVRSGTAGSAGLTLGIHVHLGSPSISVPFLLRWLAGVVLGRTTPKSRSIQNEGSSGLFFGSRMRHSDT